jgi:DNA primase
MQVRECDFKDARDWLADLVGMPRMVTRDMSPEEKSAYEARIQEQRGVYETLTDAANYYHETLMKDEKAKVHLIDHYGLTENTITTYCLGYSNGNGLHRHLHDLGYSDSDILKTGLFLDFGNRAPVELFNHRIVFPYWKSGQVVYFIGRKTDRTPNKEYEAAKYKKLMTRNERRPYISEVIENQYFYGEDSIRGANTAYVAEGVTDCLAMLQAGYPTISPVTTRFRKEDSFRLLDLIRNINTVYLVPDNEENRAGIIGARDTATELEGTGRSVYVVTLPRQEGTEKTDATDFLRDHGKDEFERLIEQAKAPIQLEIDEIAKEDLNLIRLSDRLSPIKARLASMSAGKLIGHLAYLKSSLGLKDDYIQGIKREIKSAKGGSRDASENSKGDIRYKAVSPSLVEIVKTENGDPAFLMLDGDSLKVTETIEEDGESYCPPPSESNVPPASASQTGRRRPWFDRLGPERADLGRRHSGGQVPWRKEAIHRCEGH